MRRAYSGAMMLVFGYISLLSALRASAVLLSAPSKLGTKTFDYIVVGGIIFS
jgi:hypothetical protein